MASIATMACQAKQNSSQFGVEQASLVFNGVAHVATSLALHHSSLIFSEAHCDEMVKHGILTSRNFPFVFLEVLLCCAVHGHLDAVQQTLEFWHFFFDMDILRLSDGSHPFLSLEQPHTQRLLSELVSTLIRRSCFPEWFVKSNDIKSDDPEIEEIQTLRR
jgi:hypothetical protein